MIFYDIQVISAWIRTKGWWVRNAFMRSPKVVGSSEVILVFILKLIKYYVRPPLCTEKELTFLFYCHHQVEYFILFPSVGEGGKRHYSRST